MKTIFAILAVLSMAAAPISVNAQTQTATTVDDISRICADYFPKGARYVGVMHTKYRGDGKMVPADIVVDVKGCSRSQFASGTPAVKIDVDWTVDGKLEPGISRYFGVLAPQTLRWTASPNNPGVTRRVLISLAHDRMSYVEERIYETYSNSTTMKRVQK